MARETITKCDACGELMDPYQEMEFEVELPMRHCVKAEVVIKQDDARNQPDICFHCLIDAIKKRDDRPEQAF